MVRRGKDGLIGREVLLARLDGALRRASATTSSTVLLAGPAGIGKTALLGAAVSAATDWEVGWGTCVEGDAAPGYWPWTQALNGLVRSLGNARAVELAGGEERLLAVVATALGEAEPGDGSARARLLLMDAVARWLQVVAMTRPVLVVLDDLQWADASSLELLDFLSRAAGQAHLCLLGSYRDDELSAATQAGLGSVLARGDHLQLGPLGLADTKVLAERAAGCALPEEAIEAIYRRGSGHPLFTRELALIGPDTADRDIVPLAVRGAVAHRVARTADGTRSLLRVAALAGNVLLPDVLASATGQTLVEVEQAMRDATSAGIVTTSADGTPRFDHDLFREALAADLDPSERPALHAALGRALEARHALGAPVPAAELARHFTAALPIEGPAPALRWTLAAAQADRTALAFAEASRHLQRLRSAAAAAGTPLEGPVLADVLVAEADALARAGRPTDARGLLRTASEAAHRLEDAGRIAAVALAVAQLGNQFAARRDDTIRSLEAALTAVGEHDEALTARLQATLARELQHSVPEDRPRAGPLSERALGLGRRAGDPDVLLSCLFARHDVLWTPGTADQRAEVAREIVTIAQRADEPERQAEGQLLLANALLEQGSAAFEPALEACLSLLDRQGQARHRYTVMTRRACVALLRGDLDRAATLVADAAALGERIREPDAGNVCMSQRLELVRARGEADELRAFASEAIAHWVGAPVHAHAVAAGFLARAGDLDPARHHLATVVDLGSWQTDRSYLWSVFVRELAVAAIAVDDSELCRALLADLRPLAATCGVNGAMVAFAGSHAHAAGNLAFALGDAPEAARLLGEACATYRRLGAAQLDEAARDLRGATATRAGIAGASLSREGRLWRIRFAGRQALLPHTKGMADLAVLVSRPGIDVHVLELVGSPDRSGPAGDLADLRTLDAYRRRLADIDRELDAAQDDHDESATGRLGEERAALLAEVRRATGLGGTPRPFANHPAERARKAVSARLRDTIRSLEPTLPELAAHFDRTIVTGTFCRYRADATVTWHVVDHG